jgi:ATP-dependent RNA helicase DeaD
VHRIGRTGRAGREGVAITLAEPREHRLLRNIEQLTKQKIDVATVPTPMDVRARRLDMTRGALREALEEGELDSYRVVTDALASEFDPMDVAAAAVKLAHRTLQADAAHDEEHIPSIDLSRKEPWSKGARKEPRERAAHERGAKGGTTAGRGDERRPAPGPMHAAAGSRRKPPGAATMVRVYISAGRNAGLRPADLVGAIANEAGVSAREIGAIEIEERFSLVEISDTIAEDVVRALRGTSLRGQRVTVRKDQPKRSTK